MKPSKHSSISSFETKLRNERYLPFENSGVISEWQLELPVNPSQGDPQQFDYDTISDVILHIRYTALAGGGLLRKGATDNLKTQIESAQAAGSVRLFSLRHEFPTEWARFKSIKLEGSTQFAELKLDLREEHYPFWSHDRLEAVKQMMFFARTADGIVSLQVHDKADGMGNQVTLAKDPSLGNLLVEDLVENMLPAKPTDELALYFDDNTLTELWLAVTWGKEVPP